MCFNQVLLWNDSQFAQVPGWKWSVSNQPPLNVNRINGDNSKFFWSQTWPFEYLTNLQLTEVMQSCEDFALKLWFQVNHVNVTMKFIQAWMIARPWFDNLDFSPHSYTSWTQIFKLQHPKFSCYVSQRAFFLTGEIPPFPRGNCIYIYSHLWFFRSYRGFTHRPGSSDGKNPAHHLFVVVKYHGKTSHNYSIILYKSMFYQFHCPTHKTAKLINIITRGVIPPQMWPPAFGLLK